MTGAASDINASMAGILGSLGEQPAHFADCCAGVSRPLIDALIDHLPRCPALTLSIGSGSGLLEALILEASEQNNGQALNLRGVEVSRDINKHLPPERLLEVPNTTSLHSEAVIASALM